MSKKLVETGDDIWVLHKNMFRSEEDTMLRKGKVVKHNKSSFYVVEDQFPDHSPDRYDQKTKMHSTGYGYLYVAYTDPNIYYEEQRILKEKAELRADIDKLLNNPFGLDSLENIKKAIEGEL